MWIYVKTYCINERLYKSPKATQVGQTPRNLSLYCSTFQTQVETRRYLPRGSKRKTHGKKLSSYQNPLERQAHPPCLPCSHGLDITDMQISTEETGGRWRMVKLPLDHSQRADPWGIMKMALLVIFFLHMNFLLAVVEKSRNLVPSLP